MGLSDLDFVVSHLRAILVRKHKQLKKLEEALKKGSSYEPAFCEFFELKAADNRETFETRYADAYLEKNADEKLGSDVRRVKLEIKKTNQSRYWLDAIRYAEMIQAKVGKLEHSVKAEQARQDSITIFIKMNSKGLEKIYCLDSGELIRFLDFDLEDVTSVLRFYERKNKTVNCQISVNLPNLETGTVGRLLSFEAKEISIKNTEVQKTIRDFAKDRPEVEDEMAILLKLIQACPKDDFSAADLCQYRGDICGYGVDRIRKLLRKAHETSNEEGALFMLDVKRGRYWLIEPEAD